MITPRNLVGVGAAVLLAGLTAAPSHADNDLPLHHVKYTLSAQSPIYAQIYYLDHEPAVFADWSHNPYQFMPNVAADLGPNRPAWSYELDLAKPEEWATVIANTGPEPGTPNFHCEITVDGAVVVKNDGGKGVLCSIRTW
ncbi:MAG TPA: hypothetical protein VFB19_03045 [Mycobacterium sp.]|nr:hypothetical protein [Mycobacterium sp.]